MLTPATDGSHPDVLFSPSEDRSLSEDFAFAARPGPPPQDPRRRLAQLVNQLPPEDVMLLIRLANRLRGTHRARTDQSRTDVKHSRHEP
jgi:hypothetical protein